VYTVQAGDIQVQDMRDTGTEQERYRYRTREIQVTGQERYRYRKGK